jgi:hypothetical protein
MKKIKVYIRHSYYSPNTSIPNRKRPEWFGKKKIWENFLRVTDSENCDIKIIYDIHFGDSAEFFFGEDVNIIKINCGTEASSFLETLEIIKNDDNSPDDIVYIIEDDYLHLPGWENILIEGINLGVDYISLYDHLDKYRDYPDLTSKIFVSKSSHWRTVPSTCNTYACKYSTLMTDFEIHRKYSIEHHEGVSSDNSKFLHLGNIGRILITPVPGYSTHCNLEMSPTIDWEKYSI